MVVYVFHGLKEQQMMAIFQFRSYQFARRWITIIAGAGQSIIICHYASNNSYRSEKWGFKTTTNL